MKTDLKWLLRAFALSWSVVFKLSFTFSAVMQNESFCLVSYTDTFGLKQFYKLLGKSL